MARWCHRDEPDSQGAFPAWDAHTGGGSLLWAGNDDPGRGHQIRAGPGNRLRGRDGKKIRVSGSRTVEQANGGAHFTYQATVEEHGFLRPLSPLLVRMLRRRFLGDLRRLKALMEAACPSSTSRA
jgi:hypothetical protein